MVLKIADDIEKQEAFLSSFGFVLTYLKTI